MDLVLDLRVWKPECPEHREGWERQGPGDGWQGNGSGWGTSPACCQGPGDLEIFSPKQPRNLKMSKLQVKLVISGLLLHFFFCISVTWFIFGLEPRPCGMVLIPGGDKLNRTSCLYSLLYLWYMPECRSQKATLKRQSDRWIGFWKFRPNPSCCFCLAYMQELPLKLFQIQFLYSSSQPHSP